MANLTVGAAMIDLPLYRTENISWQALEVNRKSRAALLNQRPAVVWLTGLSGSGNSTIANSVEKLLHGKGRSTYVLDGDNIRHGLNRDLGFTNEDRIETASSAELERNLASAACSKKHATRPRGCILVSKTEPGP